MCPSFKATENEEDSTRGRANALRMAISGQWDLSHLQMIKFLKSLTFVFPVKHVNQNVLPMLTYLNPKVKCFRKKYDSGNITLRERPFITINTIIVPKFSELESTNY
ncbi:MAG: hypothetical protein IPI53_10325 [Saprospiraceae bacterium]|nr:hypothetical protein [Saprospiraceae bacterium]